MSILAAGFKKITQAMQPTVFFSSATIIIVFVFLATLLTQRTGNFFNTLQSFLVNTFGWFYVASASFFLGFILWLLFSRFSDIRLGGNEAKPQFSYLGWFSMLFSAGMGIGLVFWSVAEPMMHYASPPMATAETFAAQEEAMLYTFFHWGLHPWAVYIMFSLSLAYFHFRHQLPLAPRSLLYPILGQRIYGVMGHIVDIIAVFGTLFGVATSLGLGAMQVNTGLTQLFGIANNTEIQIIIIAAITLIATISVVSGIERGIQWLSKTNMVLAALLLLFVLLTGPMLYLIELFVNSIGVYFQNLIRLSFWIDLRPESEWQSNWTLFYWSWWISWSPFVGIFIARISKGRTIREFIIGVLLVPTTITFLWLSIFGGTGLHIQLYGSGGLAEIVQKDVALGLHAMLEHLPLTSITSIFATVLVVIFFVTSSDSGSLVIDMITSGGHPNPPTAQRIFWATTEGVVAAVLLAAGGLQALQTASLTTGIPMTLFLLMVSYGLVKALKVDFETEDIPARKALYQGLSEHPER